MRWILNGIELGPFRPLLEDTAKSLKYVGECHGIVVFESGVLPGGTLELRNDNNSVVAIVRGLGAKL